MKLLNGHCFVNTFALVFLRTDKISDVLILEITITCEEGEIFLNDTSANITSPLYPMTPKSLLSYHCEWVVRTIDDFALRLEILYFNGPSWIIFYMRPHNDYYTVTFNSTNAPRSITIGNPSISISLREEVIFPNRVEGQGFAAVLTSVPLKDDGKKAGLRITNLYFLNLITLSTTLVLKRGYFH